MLLHVAYPYRAKRECNMSSIMGSQSTAVRGTVCAVEGGVSLTEFTVFRGTVCEVEGGVSRFNCCMFCEVQLPILYCVQ